MENSHSFFQNRSCEYFPCHKVRDDSSFNCLIPHSEGGYDYVLSKFSQIAELAKKKEG